MQFHWFSGSQTNGIAAFCLSAERLQMSLCIQSSSACTNHEHCSYKENFVYLFPLASIRSGPSHITRVQTAPDLFWLARVMTAIRWLSIVTSRIRSGARLPEGNSRLAGELNAHPLTNSDSKKKIKSLSRF
jgi:hypothetical protein